MPNQDRDQEKFQLSRRQLIRMSISIQTAALGFFGGIETVRAAGGVVWSFDTGSGFFAGFSSSPVVDNKTIYIGSNDDNLYALNRKTGIKKWAYKTGSDVHSSPILVNETVYFGDSGGSIYSIDAESGKENWTFNTRSSVNSSPVVVGGTVYIGSSDNNLYAITADNGEKKWDFETNGKIISSPIRLGNTVYVGSNDNNLYAVDAATGTEEWQFETGDRVRSSPTVANGTVFVGSKDGNLYAVDAATGTEEWQFETGGWIRSSPIVVNGTLYVGSDNNTFYALKAGVEGSSSGSRTKLGTLGHYSQWKFAGQTDDSGISTPMMIGATSAGLATLAGGYAWISRSNNQATGGADDNTIVKSETTREDVDTGSSEQNIAKISTVESPPRRSITTDSLNITDTIDSGGQAVIRKAQLPDGPPEKVALREPVNSGTLTTDVIKEFLSMAETWEMIDQRERNKQRWDCYEHIVGVIDTGDSVPWLAMEYMDNGDLTARMEKDPDGLPLDEALWIGESVCKGLEIAHHLGRAHLDIKPENVLLKKTDGWPWPKLADWGLARTLAEETGTIDAFSPEHAAPEQFDSDKFGDPDQLTDIYQTGSLVYTLITGQPPVSGGQLDVMETILSDEKLPLPSSRRSNIPPVVDAAIEIALEKQKSDRYDSITDFKKALQAIRTDDVVPREVTSRIEE